jgi:Tol biopolymer transport system component/DNA-binding winged helix-turn-helix (wHTH) protein
MSSPHTPPGSAPATDWYLVGHRWRVCPDINRIIDGDTEHQVADKFMQVLVVLIEAPGVVSRQELFDTVWPGTYVVDESLTRAISSLRKLFDDDPKDPKIIETIPKKGYRLLAPVEKISEQTATRASAAAVPSVTGRRRWLAPLVAVAVVVAAATAWWMEGRRHRPDHPATQMRLTALPGVEEYPSLAPAGDRVAFVWDGGDEEPDGIFVQVIDAGPPLRLTATPGHYAYPTWTPDSRHIAYARIAGDRRGIFMVPAAGGAETELVAADGESMLLAPAYSPDGRWLVFSHRADAGELWQLHRMDLETGEVECLAPSAAIPYGGHRAQFSPDGRSLAFLRLEGDRRDLVVAAAWGSNPRVVDAGGRPIADFAWTSDSSGFVLNLGDALESIDLDGSTRRILSSTRPLGIVTVAVEAPLLAFSEGRREKNIWEWAAPSDVDLGRHPTRLIHSTAWDAYPAISPDGETIAFLSDRTGTTQLWLASRDGADARQLTHLDRVIWSAPAWSRDGSRIAITVDAGESSAIQIVEAEGGRASLLTPLGGAEARPSWSRDGTALYVLRSTADGSSLWRRPISPEATDEAFMVTRDGDFTAVEAPDGVGIFFTRSRWSTDGIWWCGPDGEDSKLVVAPAAGEILTWRPTTRGLYLGTRRGPGDREYRVAFFDFVTGETTEIMTIPGRLGFHLDVDPRDDRRLVYDQTEAVASDIFAIADF